jgi:SAM-dependent methyltransferase
MHINSMLLFKNYAKGYFREKMMILEIGPDTYPSTYQEIAEIQDITWNTLDISPKNHLTYVSEGEYKFPIPDNSFDIVLSGQVIEHVKKPWVWLKEVARVCKVDGYVITIGPVSWPYHEAPCDCWRIYPEGMKALYEEAGLHVEVCAMEAYERSNMMKIIPGAGSVPIRDVTSIKAFIKKAIGWPFSFSIDTITIGRKS